MRENTNQRNAFLATKTFQISEKPFIILIILIIIVIIKENYAVVNESIAAEMIQIEANFDSQPDDNHNLKIPMKVKDETQEIKGVFHKRNEILQRSCEFVTKLNTANRIATISQLKEIHLLIHDLKISREIIAKKLSQYDETKIELVKNQENFKKNRILIIFTNLITCKELVHTLLLWYFKFFPDFIKLKVPIHRPRWTTI